MIYSAIVKNGELKMQSEFTRQAFKRWLANHENARVEFVPVTVKESRKQRGMYHGAYIPLWAYLDGKDYHDDDVLDAMHEIAKLEFNADYMIVNGVSKKYGKTTKKKLNDGYMNKILDYLVENYNIVPSDVLNPTEYKKWLEEVYPFGGPEDYISYLIEIGRLKKITT